MGKLKLAMLVAMVMTLCACASREIASGLDEQDAQEIAVVLKENGLEARAVRAGAQDRNAVPTWAVQLKGGSDAAVLAWRVLQENGLPRQKVKGLEEVFSTTGLIPTASEEKARLLMALSGEMSRTLKSIQGVVDARVQIVLPENSPLTPNDQRNPTTASVLIKYKGRQLPLSEDEVKKLVARGIEGLNLENVGVVFKRSEPVRVPQKENKSLLGDQQIVIASLALMALASVASLVLVLRTARQRAKICELESQVRELARRPVVTA
jgi:type III secretion protein J